MTLLMGNLHNQAMPFDTVTPYEEDAMPHYQKNVLSGSIVYVKSME